MYADRDGLVHWGLTPQQQPGSYQGGEMMMKSVFWWRKPEYPEETTDLWQETTLSRHTYDFRRCDLIVLMDERRLTELTLSRHTYFQLLCPSLGYTNRNTTILWESV